VKDTHEIGESLHILEGVFRALCVRMLCLDDVEKFVVCQTWLG